MDFKKYYCQEELVNLFILKNLKTEEPKLLKMLEVRKYFQNIWDKKEVYTEEDYIHKRKIGKALNHFSNLVFKEIYKDPKIDNILDFVPKKEWKNFEEDFKNIFYLKFIVQENKEFPKINKEDDKYFLNNMDDYNFLEKIIKKYDFECEESSTSFANTFEKEPIENIKRCRYIAKKRINVKEKNDFSFETIKENCIESSTIREIFDELLTELEEE